MSFNVVPGPGVIDGFSDLESLASPRSAAIRQELDADLARHDGVLGLDFTPSPDCQSYINFLIPHIVPYVGPELGQPAEEFTQKAMHLGLLLADKILSPTPFGLSTQGFKDNSDSVENFVDYTLTAPLDYLGDGRETLVDLIREYSSHFALTRRAHARALIVSGLVLLQTDQRQYELFTDRQMEQFYGELEEFDGDISALRQPPYDAS